jgi:hypothetical protein
VLGRVKSVLVIDRGEVPPPVYQSLEEDGWICGRAPNVAAALALLRQVRPALVLLGSADGGETTRAALALRQDPFMAGVGVVVLGEPAGEIGGLPERLDAVLESTAR